MAKVSIRFIKGKIRSVKNIQKLTRAMMLVASSKLIKVEKNIKKIRPYAISLQEIINDIATREENHPFLIKKKQERELIIIISGERGLCGSFNTNVLKEGENLLKSSNLEVLLFTIGKKASLYFKKRAHIIRQYPMPEREPMKLAEELADYIKGGYLKGEFDKVSLVYNEFISIFRQRPQRFQLIPFVSHGREKFSSPYIYEPDRETCLNTIFSLFFKFQIFRAFLESQGGEYASRMIAMENATKNAGDLIKKLFLTYNQARQESITKEITEITSASSAL